MPVLDKIALSLLFYGRRHGGSNLGRQPGAGAAIGAVDQRFGGVMKSVQLVQILVVQILDAFSSASAGSQAHWDVGAFWVHGDRLQLGPQDEIHVFHGDCSQQHLNGADVGHRAPVSIGQGTHLQSLQLGARGVGELNGAVNQAHQIKLKASCL